MTLTSAREQKEDVSDMLFDEHYSEGGPEIHAQEGSGLANILGGEVLLGPILEGLGLFVHEKEDGCTV